MNSIEDVEPERKLSGAADIEKLTSSEHYRLTSFDFTDFYYFLDAKLELYKTND